MGGVEEENDKVDSVFSRLSDLECWLHQMKQESGGGVFGGKDKSGYNILSELTIKHSGEKQSGLQLENWPKVPKGSQCWSW